VNNFVIPDVIRYFPQHIAKIEEFKRIAKVYDAQLVLIWDELDRVMENRHMDSMEDAECDYWEKLMQIRLTGEETMEDRRRNIKGHWVSGLPYTQKKFREVLDAIVGEKYYKLEINQQEKYLKVSLTLEAISKDDYIYDLMRAMAPADMVVKVMIIYNRYRSFKPYTHQQMAAYTHYQLRTATDFETEFNTQRNLATFKHNQLSSYMQSALMTQKL